MTTIKGKDNPGSDAAIKNGCQCAVMDNHHGKGFLFGEVISWWITDTCPLHGKKKEKEVE